LGIFLSIHPDFRLSTDRERLRRLTILLEDPPIAPRPPGFEETHLRNRFMIAARL
jgi:hypothetical protein